MESSFLQNYESLRPSVSFTFWVSSALIFVSYCFWFWFSNALSFQLVGFADCWFTTRWVQWCSWFSCYGPLGFWISGALMFRCSAHYFEFKLPLSLLPWLLVTWDFMRMCFSAFFDSLCFGMVMKIWWFAYTTHSCSSCLFIGFLTNSLVIERNFSGVSVVSFCFLWMRLGSWPLEQGAGMDMQLWWSKGVIRCFGRQFALPILMNDDGILSSSPLFTALHCLLDTMRNWLLLFCSCGLLHMDFFLWSESCATYWFSCCYCSELWILCIDSYRVLVISLFFLLWELYSWLYRAVFSTLGVNGIFRVRRFGGDFLGFLKSRNSSKIPLNFCRFFSDLQI